MKIVSQYVPRTGEDVCTYGVVFEIKKGNSGFGVFLGLKTEQYLE
jgi:hypothetical protein